MVVDQLQLAVYWSSTIYKKRIYFLFNIPKEYPKANAVGMKGLRAAGGMSQTRAMDGPGREL